MFRIGLVNLDTSHPRSFALYLEKLRRGRYAALYNDGFRGDDEVGAFMERFGVEKRCATIEELAALVDIGFIQGCDWDRHLAQARPFIAAGKPVFIDKPLAGSLSDCLEFESLAAGGAVILGSSSLRYAAEVEDFRRDGGTGRVLNVFATAGVDEFNYGVHVAEMIGGLLGTGAHSCRFVGGAAAGGVTGETFFVRYRDGRTATFHTCQGAPQPFEAVVTGVQGTHRFRVDTSRIYGALLDRICDFMETGRNTLAPVPALTESVRIMLAGRISRASGGREVSLEEIPRRDPGYDGAAFERGYAAAAPKIYLDIPRG